MALMVQLAGGLGNQMFQYATARAICERSRDELCLDTISGFARDRRFRRNFELGHFPITSRSATWLERQTAEFDGLVRSLLGSSCSIRRNPWGDTLRETAQNVLPEIETFKTSRFTWTKGYWQAPRYFEWMQEVIRTELEPPKPLDTRFLELGKIIKNENSLAIGVRLYEEARTPSANARQGRVKSLGIQAKAVHDVLKRNPASRAFVFCTHRSPALEELCLPSETIYVTETDGYRGAVANLWLLSQCRHHVFNNSSFYWWGAWLSEGKHKSLPGTIIASDNFINIDSIPSRWSTF